MRDGSPHDDEVERRVRYAPAEAPDGLSEEFEEHLAVVVVVEDGRRSLPREVR
jgi:hypothetical protein